MSIADDDNSGPRGLNTESQRSVTTAQEKGPNAIRELIRELAREAARRDHAEHLRGHRDLERRNAGAHIDASHIDENNDDS